MSIARDAVYFFIPFNAVIFLRKATAQPPTSFCLPRAIANASGGTFLVTTEPEPT
jgi:hypothetical protein